MISEARNNYYIKTLISLVQVNVLVTLIGIVTTIGIAKTIGPEQFGLIVLGASIGNILTVLIRYATDRTLLKEYIRDPGGFLYILWGGVLVKVWMLVLVAFGISVLAYLGFTANVEKVTIIVVCANLLSAFQLQTLYDAFQKTKIHLKLYLSYRMLYFSSIWIFLLLGHLDSTVVAAIMLSFSFIYLILQWMNFDGIGLPNKKWGASCLYAFSVLKNNYLLVLSALLTVSIFNIPQIVIASVLSLKVLGFYGLCWQFVSLTNLVLKQVTRLGNRRLSTTVDKKEFLNISVMLSLTCLFIVIPISILVWSFGEISIKYVFEKEYEGNGVFELLSIYIICRALLLSLEQVSINLLAFRDVFIASLFGAIVMVSLLFSLINEFGVLAPFIALTISSLTSILFFLYSIRQKISNGELF